MSFRTTTDPGTVTAAVAAIAAAFAGVLIAAGLPLSKDLTDHILVLITVLTPVVVAVIGWFHHSHAKVAAAEVLATSTSTTSASV